MAIAPGAHFIKVGSGNAGTTPDELNILLTQLRDGGVGKVVLHFHGGLVSSAKGVALANRLAPIYENAGAYPITAISATGLAETIGRNLQTLNQTRLFTKLVNVAIQRSAARLRASSTGRGGGALMSLDEVAEARAVDADFARLADPARGTGIVLDVADIDAIQSELEAEVEEELDSDPAFESLLAEDPQETPLLDQAVATDLAPREGRPLISTVAAARLIVKVIVRTLRRFVAGRDHGVIATVVEEVLRAAYLANVGAWVWSGMKTTSATMWQPASGSGEETGVGAFLLQGLSDLQSVRPELTIDLVGHSAGAIAIANLLSTAAARHPTFRVRNVFLLAPALTVDAFDRDVRGNASLFTTLRLFALADGLECHDRLVPGVYPRSLLYLVSGLLEGGADVPLVGLQRHTDGRRPYDDNQLTRVHRYLLRAPNQVIIARTPSTALAGSRSAAGRHGDFDEDRVTLQSLSVIIAA